MFAKRDIFQSVQTHKTQQQDLQLVQGYQLLRLIFWADMQGRPSLGITLSLRVVFKAGQTLSLD